MGQILQRALQLRDITEHSYFLWGPRKSGKTWWIRNHLPSAKVIDLLKSDVFAEYSARPSLLRERFGNLKPGGQESLVVIDEIQKCGALLDEVHWLIENRGLVFLLTGSSARKLRKQHANLLGGRARRREMRPICYPEMTGFSMDEIIHRGLLPSHLLARDPVEDMRAYVSDYLKEEIAQEALVRNLPAFSEFLRIAAITNSEILNYTNVSREVGVSAKVIRSYFEILEDTLLGFRIKPWRKSNNRRLVETEKFYLFDVGVAGFLARRRPERGTPEFGKSFEHYILMELMAFKAYREPEMDISFWRTAHGQEVDFIVNDKELAIEIKGSSRIHEGDIRHLSVLSEDGPVKRRVVVCLEQEKRVLRDKHGEIEILPVDTFLSELWGTVA